MVVVVVLVVVTIGRILLCGPGRYSSSTIVATKHACRRLAIVDRFVDGSQRDCARERSTNKQRPSILFSSLMPNSHRRPDATKLSNFVASTSAVRVKAN